MDLKVHVDEATGEHVMTYHHKQYEFTLAEALQYLCSGWYNYSRFEDMMLYNICLRNALRAFGTQKVIDHLREFAPADERLDAYFNDFVNSVPDGSIGDLDIQMYSTSEDVTILGQTFHGLDDIIAHREMALSSGSSSTPYSMKTHGSGGLHVGEVWESYPCFDSYDFANENRTYQNYIVRDHPITSDDLLQTKRLKNIGNCQFISEHMPLDMLPMVYYVGDGGFMLVATRR